MKWRESDSLDLCRSKVEKIPKRIITKASLVNDLPMRRYASEPTEKKEKDVHNFFLECTMQFNLMYNAINVQCFNTESVFLYFCLQTKKKKEKRKFNFI